MGSGTQERPTFAFSEAPIVMDAHRAPWSMLALNRFGAVRSVGSSSLREPLTRTSSDGPSTSPTLMTESMPKI